VSANEKLSLGVVALAPVAIMRIGAMEAATVVATARMSLRTCVLSFLAGVAGGRFGAARLSWIGCAVVGRSRDLGSF
jgi:hypothetical protein